MNTENKITLSDTLDEVSLAWVQKNYQLHPTEDGIYAQNDFNTTIPNVKFFGNNEAFVFIRSRGARISEPYSPMPFSSHQDAVDFLRIK